LQKQIKTKEMNKLEIFISNHTFIRRFSDHVQVLYIDAVKGKNVTAGIYLIQLYHLMIRLFS